MDKHYVYSARTTEKGLKALNGIRETQKISWDTLINQAVEKFYGLKGLSLPPSEHLQRRAENKVAKLKAFLAKQKEAEKAKAKKEADAKKAADKAAKDAGKKGKATKTVNVTVKPGETKVKGGTRVHADAANDKPVTVPVDVPANDLD